MAKPDQLKSVSEHVETKSSNTELAELQKEVVNKPYEDFRKAIIRYIKNPLDKSISNTTRNIQALRER